MVNSKLTLRHPGFLLKSNVIDANELTITEAAKLLKVTRVTLSNVLNGRADISPEMALRISTVFGGEAGIWMRLQITYTLSLLLPKIDKLKLKPYKTL